MPETTMNNNANISDTRVLIPRYADADTDSDSDTSSVPLSPASLESFDFTDNVPWRQGQPRDSFALDTKHRRTRSSSFPPRYSVLRARRTLILCVMLAVMLLVSGCAFGGMKARQFEKVRLRRVCEDRAGGEKCRLSESWAKCVAVDGLGVCEGRIGDEIAGLLP